MRTKNSSMALSGVRSQSYHETGVLAVRVVVAVRGVDLLAARIIGKPARAAASRRIAFLARAQRVEQRPKYRLRPAVHEHCLKPSAPFGDSRVVFFVVSDKVCNGSRRTGMKLMLAGGAVRCVRTDRSKRSAAARTPICAAVSFPVGSMVPGIYVHSVHPCGNTDWDPPYPRSRFGDELDL